MNYKEFRRRMAKLTNLEKEFIYTLTIEDAINFLKTIKIWERGKMFTTLYVIVGATLILGFSSTDISKLPLILRIFLTIFFIVIMFFIT